MKTININIGHLFFWVGDNAGREKITIGAGDGVHYTVVFKGDKRVVDFHKTIELPNGKKEYEPILEMQFFTFFRFITIFRIENSSLTRKFWFANRINIGKLGHHNLVLFPLADQSKTDLFLNTKRKKQLKFKGEIEVEALENMFCVRMNCLIAKKNHFGFTQPKKEMSNAKDLFSNMTQISEKGAFSL